MIIQCYPAYLKNITSSYLFILKLLCKLKTENHLSTYFNNLCILPESIARCLVLTLGIPYLQIFIYLSSFSKNVNKAKYFAKKLYQYLTPPFLNCYHSMGFSNLITFLNISLQWEKGFLEKIHSPLSAVS